MEGGSGYYVLDNYGPNDSKFAGVVSNGFKLSVGYGLYPRLNVGISVFRNGFLVDKESKYSGQNGGIGFYANGDLFRAPYSVIYGTLGAGYSGLVFENYLKKGKAFSNGYYISGGPGRRIDLASFISIFYQAQLVYYGYYKLENKFDNQPTGNYTNWRLNMTGLELKVGLIFTIGVPIKNNE